MTKKKITKAKDLHVTGDFIAGDQYNYYYTGDFASLAEYYISPESVFQRVQTDDFIGRDWLTAKVDAFLNDPNRKSGAFLLIGDAGVGKTSFMAHLVKDRRYLHLFAEQAPGQAMLQRAIQSLGSQLVTRYQIDPYKDRDTLNALSVFPDFLERILRLAASTLTEGEKIVIVCDALDEAGVFPDHFVFGLPKELPDGVYFILSQRPVNVKLPNFEPVIEKLEAQGEGNLNDIEAYLSAVAKRPEVAGQIRSKEYSEEFFIQTLKEKSQGVWMYLHYIIKEIESGARAPLDLANLPTGLVGYYAEYWDAWRTGKRGKGEEAWDELYAPLLTTLAAAQEAIPVDWLIRWADVTAKPREVNRLLTEQWRAFITEKEKDGQKTYTPYHLSFKDFITGRADTSKLQPTQANLVKDLASQTMEAHKRIVNAFEKECNGEWEKLVEQDYPRLHLSTHLNGAGEYEKLRIMLTEGNEKIKWAEAREKKEETYAGYLNDLTYVWDYAEREYDYALAFRCMLIENSTHSLASNIPPELLIELARTEVWSYARCLNVIRTMSNYEEQLYAIRLFVNEVPKNLVQDLFSIVSGIHDVYIRSKALISVAPLLSLDEKRRAIELINAIENDYIRTSTLSIYSRHLPNELKTLVIDKAINTAFEVRNDYDRIMALSALSPYLDPSIRLELFSSINLISDPDDRQIFLNRLIPYADNKVKNQMLNLISKFNVYYYRMLALVAMSSHLNNNLKRKAILIAKKIPVLSTRIGALVGIAENSNGGLKKELIKEAKIIFKTISNEAERAIAAHSLIRHLNNSEKSQLLLDIKFIGNESARANYLFNTLPYIKLNEFQLEKCYSIANSMENSFEHTRVLAIISQHLNGNQKEILLQKALIKAQKIINSHTLPYVMEVIASQMNAEINTQIIDSIKQLGDEESQSFILTKIIPFLNEDLMMQSYQFALNMRDENYRAAVLVALAHAGNNSLTAVIYSTLNDLHNTLNRLRVTIAVIPHLDATRKKIAVNNALNEASKIEDEFTAVHYLNMLIPFIGIDSRYQFTQKIIKKIKNIPDKVSQAFLMIDLLPNLNKHNTTLVLHGVLDIVRTYQQKGNRNTIMKDISPYLKGSLMKKGVEITFEIRDDAKRIEVLCDLIPSIDKARLRARVIKNVFLTLQNLERKQNISNALSILAPFLVEKQLQQALSLSQNIYDEQDRIDALISLIPYIDANERRRLIKEILKLVPNKNNDRHMLWVYAELSPFLSELKIMQLLSESTNRYDQDSFKLGLILSMWNEIKYSRFEENLIPIIKLKSRGTRDHGFMTITELTPVIVRFASKDVVPELYRTITDVTRWWQ